MKMSADLAAAFNKQITMELASSTAYMQMAAYFDDANLTGMAGWMRQQSNEEREHAERFFEYVLDRGNKVVIGSQEAPPSDFSGAAEVFQKALEQEQAVTASIHDLYRLASDDGDLACIPFLQEFIEEQREEESTVGTILDRVKLADDQPAALLLLDSQLGERDATD